MQPPANQSFFRGNDRILGGVCSGLAEGFHVDVLWVRLAFVVLAFVQGIGVLLYVVLWILMPERTGNRPTGQNAFDSMSSDVKRAWADLRAQFGGARPATPPPAPPSSAAPPPPVPSTAVPTPPTTGPMAVSGQAIPAMPPPAPPQPVQRNPSFLLGAILVVIGIAFLASNSGLLDWSVIWPVVLVLVGIGLVVRNLERRS